MVHEMSAHFALVHRLLNPYMYSSSNYNTDIVDVSLTHCKAQAHYNNNIISFCSRWCFKSSHVTSCMCMINFLSDTIDEKS